MQTDPRRKPFMLEVLDRSVIAISQREVLARERIGNKEHASDRGTRIASRRAGSRIGDEKSERSAYDQFAMPIAAAGS